MSGIDDLIDELERSYREVQARMSDPSVYNDHREAADVGRRLKELEEPYRLSQEWREARADVDAARDDPDLRELVAESEERLTRLEDELRVALVERDPADAKDVLVEVRQGVGGDEAALWAGELFRMLTRYAERRGFKTEQISASPSDSGGMKEVTFAVKGDGAYSVFKWEGGTHRVQRVPETEAQGRIHTSAATVAVIPEADPIADITINPADLRIDTFRASGAGGQHVNKTDSAVRLTHLPSGLVVECQDDRSQHRNRAQAMAVLASRLLDKERRERQQKEASVRKSLVGSGDRSERIRTYNFPQGRVTDHRINLTLYKIDAITDGDLFELTQTLAREHQAELLAAMAGDPRTS